MTEQIEQIIIEGDKATLVRHEIVTETLLANLAPHLFVEKPVSMPMLPQNPVRFSHFDGTAGKGVFLIETYPRRTWMRMIHDRGEGDFPDDEARETDENGIAVFNVHIPWQYFAFPVTFTRNAEGQLIDFTVHRSRLYWAKKAIHTVDDELFIAPAPNVDELGYICWGGTGADTTHLHGRMDHLVNNFWSTVFNEHLGHQTPFGGSLTEWEANSEGIEPHLQWDWWDSRRARKITVKDVMITAHDGTEINLASLDPSWTNMPDLPQNATVGRFREWIDSLPEGARRRLLLATQDVTIPDAPVLIEPAPEEAPHDRA